MITKLQYFKQQIQEALREYPELRQQILDIHDLCMLDLSDDYVDGPFKSVCLDDSIAHLEQLIENNTEQPCFTDWPNEGETKYEREL